MSQPPPLPALFDLEPEAGVIFVGFGALRSSQAVEMNSFYLIDCRFHGEIRNRRAFKIVVVKWLNGYFGFI